MVHQLLQQLLGGSPAASIHHSTPPGSLVPYGDQEPLSLGTPAECHGPTALGWLRQPPPGAAGGHPAPRWAGEPRSQGLGGASTGASSRPPSPRVSPVEYSTVAISTPRTFGGQGPPGQSLQGGRPKHQEPRSHWVSWVFPPDPYADTNGAEYPSSNYPKRCLKHTHRFSSPVVGPQSTTTGRRPQGPGNPLTHIVIFGDTKMSIPPPGTPIRLRGHFFGRGRAVWRVGGGFWLHRYDTPRIPGPTATTH